MCDVLAITYTDRLQVKVWELRSQSSFLSLGILW